MLLTIILTVAFGILFAACTFGNCEPKLNYGKHNPTVTSELTTTKWKLPGE